MQQPLFRSRYQAALKLLEKEQKATMTKDTEMFSNLPQASVQFATLDVVKKKEEGKGLPLKLAFLKNRIPSVNAIRVSTNSPTSSDYMLMDADNKLL